MDELPLMNMSKFSKRWGEIARIRIFMKRLRSYFRENWGAPAIVCFMALLLVAALFLAGGMEEIANAIAVCAYYFLVMGVVLQIICYVKFGSNKGK